jgi:PhoPQ-activated pathogenicity-related protein
MTVSPLSGRRWALAPLVLRAALGALAALAACGGSSTPSPTALDDYVAAPDPAFALEEPPAAETDLGTAVARAYRLTSQEWLTTAEVDLPLWQHWLMVYAPGAITTPTALLVVSGGDSTDGVPSADAARAALAGEMGAVVAEVGQIPNQPLAYAAADGSGYDSGRQEDGLVAYAWDRYLVTGDPRWVVQLPMTKAVVRAMDAVQRLHPEVTGFFVHGESKRGWATWLTAAVDARVVGVAPAVIDLLDVQRSLDNHYAAYGFWSPATAPYVAFDIFARLHTPEFDALAAIIDPYAYRERLTMPKYLVNATGDQFFTPDSWEWYWDGLAGEKYLRYVPNVGHGLDDTAEDYARSFYVAVATGTPRPQFEWRREDDGGLTVTCTTAPTTVTVWQAENPEARDFRLETIGPSWTSAPLAPTAGGSYYAPAPQPASGWAAQLIELEFENPVYATPFKFSTGVSIVPDTRPHAAND